MTTENKELKQSFRKTRMQTGTVVIVLAAILLEAVSAVQYYHTRRMMEHNLEQQVLIILRASAQRIDDIMNSAEVSAFNQVMHAQQHLDNPDYMFTLVENLAKNERNKIVGAGIGFVPGYYASKGYWYEPYARRQGDSVVVSQIGSAQHDYTVQAFYKTCMDGDTLKWCDPYLDPDGARDTVTTFSVPIRNAEGKPVAMLGIDMATEWIRGVLNRVHLHPSSFTLVLSQKGEVIVRPDGALCSIALAARISSMINDSTVEKEDRADGRVSCFSFYDDEKNRAGRVYFAKKLYEPKWLMAKVCYDDEAFDELDEMRTNILWQILAGLLVMGVVIHLFTINRNRLSLSLMTQERIDGELRIAQAIHKQILPRENAVTSGDVSVHASLTPAREVGGDLYDYFVRDEKLFFCIGDVSGKGIPAAMVMAVTQSLFHNIAISDSYPAHIVKRLNLATCRNNDSNVFVTLFAGVLDLPTGRLRYCNAGHEIPFLIRGGKAQMLSCLPNLPIGLFSDFKYEMQETVLEPGTLLFLYTDGLTEARNAERQLFGRDRVKQLAAHPGGADPRQFIEMVIGRVTEFAGDSQQSDDLTLLAVSYSPKKAHLLFDEQLTLQNNLKEVKRLSVFVKDAMARLEVEAALAKKLRLALEEAVVNVMDYAYPAGNEGNVDIRVTYDGQRLRFVISDTGIAFDPTEVSMTDTTLSAEDRPVGGLGILLIRELVDTVNYERLRGGDDGSLAKNVLTLTKVWKK